MIYPCLGVAFTDNPSGGENWVPTRNRGCGEHPEGHENASLVKKVTVDT